MTDVRARAFIRSVFFDLIPFFSIILLVLMTVVPHTMPPSTRAGSLWPLMGISFWTLARPRGMKLPMVFLLGLVVDIVTFVPFGIHAAVFCISQFILMKQRRFLLGQGFWVLWAAFALLAVGVYSVLYLLLSLFTPSAISFTGGLVGVSIAWACLPLLVWLLSRLNDTIDLFDDPVT